jgi:hypothetical protein
VRSTYRNAVAVFLFVLLFSLACFFCGCGPGPTGPAPMPEPPPCSAAPWRCHAAATSCYTLTDPNTGGHVYVCGYPG